jgi:hypothetical protein
MSNKKINESGFKRQFTIPSIKIPNNDFMKKFDNDSDSSSRIKNTENSLNDGEYKRKSVNVREPKVFTIYYEENSENKSINYDNYYEGESNFFQKLFCCSSKGNNNDCFIF